MRRRHLRNASKYYGIPYYWMQENLWIRGFSRDALFSAGEKKAVDTTAFSGSDKTRTR
jgi:hypothetical protein